MCIGLLQELTPRCSTILGSTTTGAATTSAPGHRRNNKGVSKVSVGGAIPRLMSYCSPFTASLPTLSNVAKPKGRRPQNLKIMAQKGGHENLKMGTKRDQKGDLRKLKIGNNRGADWGCGGLTCLISNLPTWGREWGGIKFYPKLVLENQWHLCILVW